MGVKKTKVEAKQETPKESPKLTYEEYVEIIKLAQKIRKEQLPLLAQATTDKEKTELQKKLFEQYNIKSKSSEDTKDTEKSVILKVNIFIPDNQQFYNKYILHNKNIRLIADDYQIAAPFIINKISELQRYGLYYERMQKEGLDFSKPEIPKAAPKQDISSSEPKKQTKANTKQSTKSTSSHKGKNDFFNFDDIYDAVSKPKSTGPVKQNIMDTPQPKTKPDSVSEKAKKFFDFDDIYDTVSKPKSTRKTPSQTEISTQQDIPDPLRTQFIGISDEFLKILYSNRSLSAANEKLKKDKDDLTKQILELRQAVEQLQKQNKELTQASGLFSDHTLRQQMKDLQYTNKELQNALNTQAEQLKVYRNRAICAEAQAEQMRDSMGAILQQVNAIEFDHLQTDSVKTI